MTTMTTARMRGPQGLGGLAPAGPGRPVEGDGSGGGDVVQRPGAGGAGLLHVLARRDRAVADAQHGVGVDARPLLVHGVAVQEGAVGRAAVLDQQALLVPLHGRVQPGGAARGQGHVGLGGAPDGEHARVRDPDHRADVLLAEHREGPAGQGLERLAPVGAQRAALHERGPGERVLRVVGDVVDPHRPGGQGGAVDALHELAQGGGVGEGLQLDRPGVVVEVDDQAHGRFLSGRRRGRVSSWRRWRTRTGPVRRRPRAGSAGPGPGRSPSARPPRRGPGRSAR